MTAPETKCPRCGQPEWPCERDWMNDHPATMILLARRGGVRAIEVDFLGRRMEEIRVAQGTLCWNAEVTRLKERMAALVREIIAEKPEIALRDVLVAEYLATKPEILTGKKSVGTMTARESAGMFLKVGGAEGALAACNRTLADGKHRTDVRHLIREAVNQVPPEVEA